MSTFSDQLKAQADMGRLIGEFVKLRPAANGWTGLCPFHGEKTASFHVHSARRFYYCFGCHAHGDIYAFFMQLHKLSFAEAVAAVAEKMGVPVPAGRSGEEDSERGPLRQIHAAAAASFLLALRGPQGARARAYLQEREFSPAAAELFGLGFAPDSGRALAQALAAQGFSPELALRSGLCQMRRESAGALPAAASLSWADLYDRFRDRVMFPIGDERGAVIAFGGRSLESATPARPVPKYLNSPETPLYTKGRVVYNLDRAREAIRKLDYFILVEGYFDCMRVYLAGFQNVVASCGTALTSGQVHPLARLTRHAIVNFDPDAAGAAAAERSIGLLLEEGLGVEVVVLESGQDPDLHIRRHGPAAYAEALRGRRPFFDYLADRAATRAGDLRRPEAKAAAINHLLPYLSRVADPLMRQRLAENLAARLEVHQPLVSRQLRQAVRERRSSLSQPAVRLPALLPAERVVLRAWLEWTEQRAGIARQLRDERLLDKLAGGVLAERLYALEAEGLDTAAMAARLPDSERALLASLLLEQASEPLTAESLAQAMQALRRRQEPGFGTWLTRHAGPG